MKTTIFASYSTSRPNTTRCYAVAPVCVQALGQSGSHLLIRHFRNPQRYAIIPMQSRRTIPPGTLKHILDSAQVTIEMLEEV